MYEIGRLCVKIAGRDANKKCVIIEVLDDVYVMIDGQTRRRKCNIIHLEPLDKVLKIKKGASHTEVKSVLKKEKILVVDTKPKPKKEKPIKGKATEKKETKKIEKKETKKEEKPKSKKTAAKKTEKTKSKKKSKK